MRISNGNLHAPFTGCLLLALAGVAHAQDTAAPVGVPAHPMLEDPFNRSFLFDELEMHESDALSWDATFWAGRSFNKLAVRTEGEKSGGDTERADVELLWSHSFARWWDFVTGAREDFEPGEAQSWAAFGVQGLAPQRFEIEATAYFGEGGRSAARFEGEYELLITQRLILQPQLELNWYGQEDAARGVGPGLSTGEAALRLRYELRREVAPYLGLVREHKYGATADTARSNGDDPDDTRLVVGVRLRF
ncbi:MAG TPA: copper resistance protein B [Gammaproteobacteria bacterium]